MEIKEVETKEVEPTENSIDNDLDINNLDVSELEKSLLEEDSEQKSTETKSDETNVPITDDEVIEVEGEKIPLQEAIKAFKNKNEWQKSNTQKAQEIAEEKRRLEEEQRRIEEEKARIQLLMQQNPLQQQQQKPPEETNTLAELGLDPDEIDPATKIILDRLQKQEQRFNEWQQQLEEQQFIERSKMQHEKLKSQFPDYDPNSVEQAILKGRDPFEDTYKALKYDAILKGDPEKIKTIIPEEVMNEIKKDVRKQLIEDLRKREKKLKNVSTSTPTGQSLPKFPEKAPDNYTEAKKDVLQMIAEEGLSLTE